MNYRSRSSLVIIAAALIGSSLMMALGVMPVFMKTGLPVMFWIIVGDIMFAVGVYRICRFVEQPPSASPRKQISGEGLPAIPSNAEFNSCVHRTALRSGYLFFCGLIDNEIASVIF